MAPPLVRLRGRQQKTRQSPQSDPVLCRVGKRGEEPTQEQTFIYYEHKHTENKYIYISIQYFPLQTPLTPPNLYKKNETRTAKDSNLRFPPFHKILSNAHIRFGPLKFNEIPTLFLANAQSKDSQFGYATGGTANVFRTSWRDASLLYCYYSRTCLFDSRRAPCCTPRGRRRGDLTAAIDIISLVRWTFEWRTERREPRRRATDNTVNILRDAGWPAGRTFNGEKSRIAFLSSKDKHNRMGGSVFFPSSLNPSGRRHVATRWLVTIGMTHTFILGPVDSLSRIIESIRFPI